MSVHPRPNPPWNPYEKLELMTEILKSLNLPPGDLLPIVRRHGEPRWDNMALPPGRTLGQCKAMYREFVLGQPTQMPLHQGGLHGLQPPGDPRPPQPLYLGDAPATMQSVNPRYQEIQPRPANFAAGSGLSMAPATEPPRKKRGRPTKAESELRKEAAKSRGESMPAYRRDTVHAGSSHGPQSVAAQAAQAVMAPMPSPAGPSAMPETLSTNRKRPLSREGTEGTSRAPTVTEEDPTPQQQPPPPSASRSSFRDYPQILSQDSTGGTSTFKAPRGGE